MEAMGLLSSVNIKRKFYYWANPFISTGAHFGRLTVNKQKKDPFISTGE